MPKRNPICYGSPKKRSSRFQLDRNPFGTFEAYNRTWTQQQYKFSRRPSRSSDMDSSKDTDDQSVSTAASFSTAQSSFSDTNDAHSSVDSLISRLDNISLDSERILKEHNEENSRRRPKNDAYVAFTKNVNLERLRKSDFFFLILYYQYIGLRRKAQNILDVRKPATSNCTDISRDIDTCAPVRRIWTGDWTLMKHMKRQPYQNQWP